MALENIILEHEKGIATIFINRPEKLNALNRTTIQELHEILKLVEENPEVRVIIITGSGEKAFVAGADIAEFANFSAITMFPEKVLKRPSTLALASVMTI